VWELIWCLVDMFWLWVLQQRGVPDVQMGMVLFAEGWRCSGSMYVLAVALLL